MDRDHDTVGDGFWVVVIFLRRPQAKFCIVKQWRLLFMTQNSGFNLLVVQRYLSALTLQQRLMLSVCLLQLTRFFNPILLVLFYSLFPFPPPHSFTFWLFHPYALSSRFATWERATCTGRQHMLCHISRRFVLFSCLSASDPVAMPETDASKSKKAAVMLAF